MSARSVTVVGGGLAGISAALDLADAGCAVTLHESRARLGGLTHSFRRGEIDVDNGQHVFLRCCTEYLGLLQRLGVSGQVSMQRRLDVPVQRLDDGRRARLRRDPLPAPLHLSRSLASYAVLTPVERMRAVRAALALRRVDRDDPATDAVSFGDWLARHRQSRAAVDALWDLVGVATMNAPADDASLAVAATVFQIGLLTASPAADIGWAAVPLQRLHGDAAMRALQDAGVDVRLRSRVDDVDNLDADAVVVATDANTAERLCGSAVALPEGWSEQLGNAPIVNLHLVLDRPVLPEPFIAAIGGAVQWVFDRTAQSGLRNGQYVAVSLSAADQWVERTVAELRATFLPELHVLLPKLREAALLDFFVTREPQATFRAAPGSGKWRPPAQTREPRLFLAGAYTATGWPATMEGAVRSGHAAAQAALHAPRRVAAVPA